MLILAMANIAEEEGAAQPCPHRSQDAMTEM